MTATLILAKGAGEIASARAKGMKPDEMIIVSLIGPVGESNHTVYANPDGEYCWSWVKRLQLCIYANQRTDWQTIKPITMAIALERPEWLGLWNVDRFEGTDVCALPLVEDIAKPPSQWRYKLHFLPWLPFQNEHFAWGNS
jgi:hypothetical protein